MPVKPAFLEVAGQIRAASPRACAASRTALPAHATSREGSRREVADHPQEAARASLLHVPRSRRLSPPGIQPWSAAGVVAGAALVALALLGAHLRAAAQSPPVERIVPAVQTISTGDAYAQFDVTA